jgi:hypothetical protein
MNFLTIISKFYYKFTNFNKFVKKLGLVVDTFLYLLKINFGFLFKYEVKTWSVNE